MARRKQHTTCLATFNKWMAEQGLREMAKRQVIKSYKGQEIVENHDCQCPEEIPQHRRKRITMLFLRCCNYLHCLDGCPHPCCHIHDILTEARIQYGNQ